MNTGPQTWRVAEFVCSARWEAFPKEVQDQAIRCVLDLLGSTVAGSRTRAAQLVNEYALDVYGKGAIPLIGTESKSTPVGAALANGFAANALDLDDGYRPAKGHPSAAVIPAVLAATERTGATGKEFLTSVVVGLEIAMRAGSLLHALYDFYHGTGAWGPIGAAAGAARLLGGDEQTTWNAMGIAEFHAPITPEMRHVDHPGMLKDGIGWGAMVGLASAQMAVRGFAGIPSLFDESSTGAVLADGLGCEYLILDLYFKPYACCRWAQPAIEGALLAAAKLGAKGADIAKVRVYTFEAATRLRGVAPTTAEEAQFSLPWLVACALTEGTVGPEQVLGGAVEDPNHRALASRVEMIPDPELEGLFPDQALARVEIETADGRRSASGSVPAPGDPGSSLTDKELASKFNRLSAPVLGPDRTEELLHTIQGLPEAANLGSLFDRLSAARSS